MIVFQCAQRSPEWFQARLAIPTTSNFDKILTPGTGKLSAQSDAYMHDLLAEFLTSKPNEAFKNEWMERGIQLEAEAKSFYEMSTGRTIQEVGFVYQDEKRLVGCSPDGLFEDGGLEIKVPKASTHVKWLLKSESPTKYYAQLQGALLVTGLPQWSWLSYHPDMPSCIIRVERDEKYIRTLNDAVQSFVHTMLAKRIELVNRGFKQG